MWRFRLPAALVAGLILGTFAIPAAAQFACTTPNDPACNHLKCYQIKGAPITVNVQIDNQFDREAFVQLQPVLLCTPAEKTCCTATGVCSPNNCPPNPVPAPGLPHFKCYKFRGRTVCSDPACTSTVKFPKGTQVTLTDQFGVETNVAVGKPVIFCAPALKQVVGSTTTTTSSTTTTLCVPPNCPTTTTSTTTTASTTTTTLLCHFDPANNACAGPCPPNAPPGSQCLQVAANTCDCVAPPVCCQCTGSTSPACVDTNGPCPTGCSPVPNASCNSSTGQCGCGFCLDLANGACSTTPCSTSQPCPSGSICDPVHCPAPCSPCVLQGTVCTGGPCLRANGTMSNCSPGIGNPCSCCGVNGQLCIADSDCCSGHCNTLAHLCF